MSKGNKATTNRISPPDDLSDEAAAKFARLVSEVDHRWEAYHADVLGIYCETYYDLARMRNALHELKNETILIVRSDGQQQLTPLIAAIKEYTKLVRELGAELGLSPMSESKGKLESPPAAAAGDPLADLHEVAKNVRQRSSG